MHSRHHGRKSIDGGTARRHFGRRAAAAVLAGTILGITGCDGLLDSLLDVDAPSQVEAGDAESPRNASLLVDGAVADFECAFAHYINVGGLLGEELTDAQQTAAQWDYDRRTLDARGGWYATSTCNDRMGAYTPLSTARWAADNMLTKLGEWSDQDVANRTQLMATVAAYSGYAHVLMGEGFCTAAFDAGPELSRAQVFARAEERFTLALQLADQLNNAALANLARVGRARARLNLGRLQDAAADAADVPAGFVFNANYSAATSRSENAVRAQNARTRNTSVEALYRNLTVEGVPDTRVSLTNTGLRGSDNQTFIFLADKYASESSPIPIARYAEARLILAEAQGGQQAVDIMNALRAAHGLPPYTGPVDAASVRELLIHERRRELFLESHHLGDLIRYDEPLRPAPGTPWHNGAVYGSTRCMPLPDVERMNNPTLSGG
jgi:starch-binding outer membrane protein, SusD/RagB family